MVTGDRDLNRLGKGIISHGLIFKASIAVHCHLDFSF
jgi:hypothetical protein